MSSNGRVKIEKGGGESSLRTLPKNTTHQGGEKGQDVELLTPGVKTTLQYSNLKQKENILVRFTHNHKSIQLCIKSKGKLMYFYLRHQYHQIVNNLTFPEVEIDHLFLIFNYILNYKG